MTISTAPHSTKHLYLVENMIREMSRSSSQVDYNGASYTLDAGVLPNSAAVEDFFRTIVISPYTAMNFGVIPPCSLELRPALDTTSKYDPRTATILIAQKQWSMCKMVVLHEFAHHIDFSRHGVKTVDRHHDEKFLDIYATLLSIHLGEGTARLLRDMT